MSIYGIISLEERQCSPAVRKMQLHSRLRCSDSPVWFTNQLHHSLYNQRGHLIASCGLGYKVSGPYNDMERKSAVGALPLLALYMRQLPQPGFDRIFLYYLRSPIQSPPPNCLFKLSILMDNISNSVSIWRAVKRALTPPSLVPPRSHSNIADIYNVMY